MGTCSHGELATGTRDIGIREQVAATSAAGTGCCLVGREQVAATSAAGTMRCFLYGVQLWYNIQIKKAFIVKTNKRRLEIGDGAAGTFS